MHESAGSRYTSAMTLTLFLVLIAAATAGGIAIGWALGRTSTERRLLVRELDVVWPGGHEVATPVAEREGRP